MKCRRAHVGPAAKVRKKRNACLSVSASSVLCVSFKRETLTPATAGASSARPRFHLFTSSHSGASSWPMLFDRLELRRNLAERERSDDGSLNFAALKRGD